MSINDYIDGSDYLKIPRPTGQQFSINQLQALLKDLLRSYTQYDNGPTMPNVKPLNQKAPQYLFYLLFKDSLDKLTRDDQEQKIWSCLPPGNNHRSEAENLAKLVEYYLQSFSASSHPNSCEFFQKIYYGAPGTGKSYEAKKITKNHVVFRTTFHPDTDYAAFVGAYKPVPKVVNGTEKISYEFVPQVFTEAYIEAWKQYLAPKEESKEKKAPEVCLLIEELNRGNCAQIFGDLFQLLDRSKNAFSEYSVLPSADLAKYIRAQMNDSAFEAYYKAIRENSDRTENGSYCIPEWDGSDINRNQLRLCLPPNLSIVCTMNTSDQSLFPMDSAFKRRWDWEYVPIQYKCPKSQFTINLDDSHKYDWNMFLEKINGIIYEQTKSEDKQMGNFFVKGDENFEVSCEQFVSKVMFYLWSEICKDNPKARKEIFVAAANQADGTETTEEFTFNDLFSYRKIELLSGFMEHLGIGNE